MRLAPRRRPPRGLTLVELMVSIVILAVVTAAVTKVIVDVLRTQAVREVTTRLQGDGRDALRRVEHELRAASLGAPVGLILSQDAAGNVVRRPAVQIFDALPGGNNAHLPVKPGSDAVLVVTGVGSGAEGALQGTCFDSTAEFVVTDRTPFTVGMNVLIGPFKAAAWDTVRLNRSTGLTLTSTQNVFPDGKAESGSLIRQAKATLYYLSSTDQLVEQELLVPRPPSAVAQMGNQRILARGVENLQIDCELDDGLALQACGAVMGTGELESSEAVWAFGTWGTGGPRLNQGNIATLRTVIPSVVARGRRGLANQGGDDPIAIGNASALEAGNPDPTRPSYVRRAYRLPVAIRNTSLGAL